LDLIVKTALEGAHINLDVRIGGLGIGHWVERATNRPEGTPTNRLRLLKATQPNNAHVQPCVLAVWLNAQPVNLLR
jgi:hypothetical protein